MDTKALRQKILDLAIRGKLVPQDPSDEPASVLLERIREQKKQMVKEGKLKAKDIKNDTIIFVGEDNLHYEKFQDGTVKCIEDEIPFEVPEGWEWARLQYIISLSSGKTIKVRQLTDEGDFPVYGGNGINGMYSDYNVEPKTIVIGRVGYYCGSVYKTISKAWVTDNALIATIKEPNIFDIDFLVSTLTYLNLGTTSVSTAQPVVSGKGILPLIVPIPPKKEQNRILRQIKKIAPLLDAIENSQKETLSLIANTKSKILDLAIRGKLVPQDPNDEPASVLLERIHVEKEELIKQGKIKRDKKESVIFKGDDNSYYGIHLPDSWNWASLREIALSISDGSHNPPPNNGSGIPLLSAANINDNSILMNEISRWITNEEWKIENQRTNIEVGDVLLTIVGSIGRSAVVHNNNHFALQRSVAVIKPYLINPLYLMYIVQSPQIQKWLTDNSKGTAQKGIYLNALSLMLIPIPPLAEQARIVEHIHIAYKQLDLISNALL